MAIDERVRAARAFVNQTRDGTCKRLEARAFLATVHGGLSKKRTEEIIGAIRCDHCERTAR